MSASRARVIPGIAVLVAASFGFSAAFAAQPGSPASTLLPSHLRALIGSAVPAFPALQTTTEKKAKAPATLPDGKGKDVTMRVCTGCHSVSTFAGQRHTADQWATIVDTMVSRGLDAPDADLATINSYLSTYLAPPKDDTAPAAPPQQ